MTPALEQAVVGKQGRMVIPAEVRDALDIRPGTVLTFLVRDGEMVISTPRAAALKLQELFASAPRDPARLASELLIAERREEARA